MRDSKKKGSSALSESPLSRALAVPYRSYRNFLERFKGAGSRPVSKLYVRARNVKRNLRGRQLKFVSVDNAIIWTLDWIKTFPTSYDVVIGIPRSGLFFANLVAIKLGLPLTTPDFFKEGKFWHSKKVKNRPDIGMIDRLLLVDDSVDSGRSEASRTPNWPTT